MKSGKTIIQIIKNILELYIIVLLVIQVKNQCWMNVFLCITTIFLFRIPMILKNQFHLIVPLTIEIVLYLFVISAIILGEIIRFYLIIPHWDTILHMISGFVAASLGFSMLKKIIIQKELEKNTLMISILIISIASTIGLIWEFCEFSLDYYFQLDMQKDTIVTKISTINKNNSLMNITEITKTILNTKTNSISIENGYLDIGLIDTMKDLFVTILGAILFCYIYFIDKKQIIIGQFIIKKNRG